MGPGTIDPLPRIIGGRYGLSSKELTPPMVKAVLDELFTEKPRTRFTVGINDDVTHLSLRSTTRSTASRPTSTSAMFFGLGSDGTVSSNKASIKIIGDTTPLECQGYFVYDSKKSGATTVSHLRFGPHPIRSTYQIRQADFVGIHDPGFLDRVEVLDRVRAGGTVLLNVAAAPDAVWAGLPRECRTRSSTAGCRLFAIDANTVAERCGWSPHQHDHADLLLRARRRPVHRAAIAEIKASVTATWGKRGAESCVATSTRSTRRSPSCTRSPSPTMPTRLGGADRPCPTTLPTSCSGSPACSSRGTATVCP